MEVTVTRGVCLLPPTDSLHVISHDMIPLTSKTRLHKSFPRPMGHSGSISIGRTTDRVKI